MSWVLYVNEQTRGHDRLVLIAYADSADAGTGYGFNGVDTLARAARVDRTTVMAATKRLEQDGQLIVHRPEVRGRGHHNQYVVVMGRDPHALAAARGWPRPALSAAAAAQLLRRCTPPEPVDNDHDPDIERSDHDRDPDIEWSGWPTDTDPEGSENGRRTVGPGPTIPSPGPNPNFKSAQEPRASTRVGTVDKPLAPVRLLVEEAGVRVRWDLPPEKESVAVAALKRRGPRALALAALDQVAARGTPRSAVAWVEIWREQALTLGAGGGHRPSTTDRNVAQTLALVAELRAQEQAESSVTEPCRTAPCASRYGGTSRRLEDVDGRDVGPCPECAIPAGGEF